VPRKTPTAASSSHGCPLSISIMPQLMKNANSANVVMASVNFIREKITAFRFHASLWRGRSALNKIAEVFQLDGEVDVIDHHVLRHGEDAGREIQDARDARLDKLVGDGLGYIGWH